MAAKQINKHGLNRYIPAPIREKIRKDAGYGCVICGSLFGDYEHIEPEYHDAHEHNPEHMTYLCVEHHSAVTRNRLSKKAVWKAKLNPKAKSQGYVSDFIYPDNIEPEIVLGNSKFKLTNIITNVCGKPLLWFEKPKSSDAPILLNAIFYDEQGKATSFINRNQFIGIVKNHDISTKGPRITIRPQKGVVGLELEVSSHKPITINTLKMSYLNAGIEVCADGEMLIKHGNSCISLGKVNVENCGTGFGVGGIPRARVRDSVGILKKLTIALNIIRVKSLPIVDYTGAKWGWKNYNLLINHDYYAVGLESDGKIYSITNELIGSQSEMSKNIMVLSHKNEYDSMEPIWTHPIDTSTFNIKLYKGYDLSHRFRESRE